jgi:hypothetical protein
MESRGHRRGLLVERVEQGAVESARRFLASANSCGDGAAERT